MRTLRIPTEVLWLGGMLTAAIAVKWIIRRGASVMAQRANLQ
jgi:hypothetical protein